jgi:hypothetical protein
MIPLPFNFHPFVKSFTFFRITSRWLLNDIQTRQQYYDSPFDRFGNDVKRNVPMLMICHSELYMADSVALCVGPFVYSANQVL